MGKIFRSFSLSGLTMFSLAGLMAVSIPQPAHAQWTVIDPAEMQELEDITNFDAGVWTSDTATITAAIATQTAALTLVLQNLFGMQSSSNNNAHTMGSQIVGKQGDYLASQQFTLTQQHTQAEVQNQAGAGNSVYMHANLCQNASLQSGASTMENAQAMELAAYNGYRSGKSPLVSPTGSIYQGVSGNSTSNGPTCTTCGYATGGKPSGGPANVIGAEFVQIDPQKMVQNVATAAASFFGNAEGKQDGQQLSGATDTTAATHLDVDALSLSLQETYTDAFQQAHDMLSIYLVGLPPPIIPAAASYTGNQSTYPYAVLSSREKLAFQNLSGEALAKERAYHNAVKSGAANSVSAIFTAANFADPSYQGYVSPAALDDALYKEPADDPSFASNFAGMNEGALLGFIADEMLLLNKMEYKRYLQEMEMYKVESASLNLQQRTFNFQQNP